MIISFKFRRLQSWFFLWLLRESIMLFFDMGACEVISLIISGDVAYAIGSHVRTENQIAPATKAME